jgi:hypothetical protein
MTGIIGNQENKTLNAPSIRPDTIPAELVLMPPEELILENPLNKLLANTRRKT